VTADLRLYWKLRARLAKTRCGTPLHVVLREWIDGILVG
jgi:hypothetical protein